MHEQSITPDHPMNQSTQHPLIFLCEHIYSHVHNIHTNKDVVATLLTHILFLYYNSLNAYSSFGAYHGGYFPVNERQPVY